MVDIIRRISAAFLVIAAAAAFFNLILTPVYHDGSAEYPTWKILNYFMALATLLALRVGLDRRRALGDGASTVEYLGASFAFYGAIVLTMLFFWEWFWTLNPDSETGDAVTSHLVYFPIVDALFVVVALSSGRHLWNLARRSEISESH